MPHAILQSLYRLGETVAGSEKEKIAVEELRARLEPLCDEVRVEYVPVTVWSERHCVVEAGGKIVECSAHPPTPSIDIEAKIVKVGIDDVFRKRVDAEDKLVVVEGVEDPDDVAEATSILSDLGALGVVFVDPLEALRRVVVYSEAVPCYRSPKRRAVPAVHVPRSVSPLLETGNKARILVEADKRKGFGMNVVGDIHGSRERLVYLSAHHDHWFWGCIDNLVGVAMVLDVARELQRLRLRKSLRIAFFSAEEGLPESETPFYWAVGSRMHVVNNWRDVGERIEIMINIDVPYGSLKLAATGLEAVGLAKYLGIDVDPYGFIYDTFPFSALGVPTLTIENFEATLEDGIYHSTLDDLNRVSTSSYARGVSLARQVLKIVDGIDVERFASLGLLEVSKQLINRGALPSIAVKGVQRCLERVGLRREVLRVVNSAVFGYAIDKNFLTKPGVRELSGVVPWNPGTIEVPTGMRIDGWRRAYEKTLSILNTLYYVCRGS